MSKDLKIFTKSGHTDCRGPFVCLAIFVSVLGKFFTYVAKRFIVLGKLLKWQNIL